MKKVDVCIVGGGMVGATLACALAKNSDLSILVVEAFPIQKPEQIEVGAYRPSYDARSTALSRGTAEILQQLDCWSRLREQVAPILDIHVSEKGNFGFSRLSAEKECIPALGYVVENRWLGAVLTHQLFQHPNIEIVSPAKVASLSIEVDGVYLALERSSEQVENCLAELLIVADGQDSQTRAMLGIEVESYPYHQKAIVANISPDQQHQFVAYERFTENGPLALLPLRENRYALVWTLSHEEAEATLLLPDEAFLSKLQSQFGQRIGHLVKVGERVSYPLQLMRAKEQIRPRAVVVGNAAHTLHPIAGQGFNVAARDVASLAAIVKAAHRRGKPLSDFKLLERYWDERRLDQEKVIQFSDKLLKLFGAGSELIRVGRNLGLIGLDLWGPAKGTLTKHAMGKSHYVSVL